MPTGSFEAVLPGNSQQKLQGLTHVLNRRHMMSRQLVTIGLVKGLSLNWHQAETMLTYCQFHPWWRHQMETSSALLANCAENSAATGEFSAQRSVTWSFDVFFDLRLHKRLSEQSKHRWFETLSHPLGRHCNAEGTNLSEICKALCHKWYISAWSQHVSLFCQWYAHSWRHEVHWDSTLSSPNRRMIIFIQQNVFENIICKMAAILCYSTVTLPSAIRCP